MWGTVSDNFSLTDWPLTFLGHHSHDICPQVRHSGERVFCFISQNSGRMLFWNWVLRIKKKAKNNSPSFTVGVFSFVLYCQLLGVVSPQGDGWKDFRSMPSLPSPSSLVSCHSHVFPHVNHYNQPSSFSLTWCWFVDRLDLPVGFPSAHSTGHVSHHLASKKREALDGFADCESWRNRECRVPSPGRKILPGGSCGIPDIRLCLCFEELEGSPNGEITSYP